MEITVSFEDMTLRELEDFEQFTGMQIQDIKDPKRMPAKVLTAMVWISERRKNPEFTLDDARDLKIDDIEFAGDADPPTSGGSTPPSPRSATSTGSRRKSSGRSPSRSTKR